MAKEIRQGKTTKLIRETEKDTIGLPPQKAEEPNVKNPIPEEITAPVADLTEIIIEDETLHEEKPAVSLDDKEASLDEIEITITETEESKERKRKNKKNFLLLALGGLALLYVANS